MTRANASKIESTPKRIEFGKLQIFDKFFILFYAVNAFVLDK